MLHRRRISNYIDRVVHDHVCTHDESCTIHRNAFTSVAAQYVEGSPIYTRAALTRQYCPVALNNYLCLCVMCDSRDTGDGLVYHSALRRYSE